MRACERMLVDTKLLVHVLVCVFAISSWVDINGLWVELPILVTSLPEQWTLPSYIIALSQVANLGPIVFFVLANCVGKTRAYKITLDKVTSYAIMVVGVTSTLLMAFLWRRTVPVAGAERSLALLALSFFLAVMDCTSSMAYVAFMAALKPAYMASFFLGEGLSGLLPALLALGQGAGDIVCVNGSSTSEQDVNGTVVNVTDLFFYPMYLEPRFSVQVFFVLLSCIIALSITSFTLINYWPYCRDQFVTVSFYSLNPDSSVDKGGKEGVSESIEGLHYSSNSSSNSCSLSAASQHNPAYADAQSAKSVTLVTKVYSSLPYGISVYNLVVTLSNIANPLACAISIFLTVTSTHVITALTSLGVACGAYIIVTAAMSPTPPMVDTAAGGPVAVVIWVGASFFLTFAKISAAGVMRTVGRRALIWYGAATQGGALIGALTGFVLVNEFKIFKDAPWC